MLQTPPHTPPGGFTNGLSKLKAQWLNYVAYNIGSAVDGIGGGYYQLAGADLEISSDTRALVLNHAGPSHPAELRGYTLLAAADDTNYPTGQGACTVEIPLVMSGAGGRFRERAPVVASAAGQVLALTADTYRIPSLSGDVSYVLPRTTTPAPEGGECVRVICRGNNSGHTITITSEGSQGAIVTINGGVYVVAEFRFDGTVALVGDGLGAWFLASPVQTGITPASPYPII